MALEDYLVPAVKPQFKASLCFDCKKACGGCCWTAYDDKKRGVRFEPVPGWNAEEVELLMFASHGRRYTTKTYRVIECPLFDKDDERRGSHLQLTPEQSREFMANIRSVLRKWANEEEQQAKKCRNR